MSRLRQERITDVAGVMGAAAGAAIKADLENKRLRADLAACRARLAALVAEFWAPNVQSSQAALSALMVEARDWLAQHPAEGGQDGAVR